MNKQERTISISEFKAKCLAILENLDRNGIVILKRGHPIARVMPLRAAGCDQLIGSMAGKIKVKGNILSTGIRWDVES